MPMLKETDFGTDKDGRRNTEYCHYCFQAGQFTNPNLTLEEQISKLTHMAMGQNAISEKDASTQATKVLPNLKRWQGQNYQPKHKYQKVAAIILIIAIIIGVAITLFYKKLSGDNIDSNNNSDGWATVSMIPIWIAIFIPIITQKKNKLKNGQKESDPLQKKNLFLLVIAVLLLVIGVFLSAYFMETK